MDDDDDDDDDDSVVVPVRVDARAVLDDDNVPDMVVLLGATPTTENASASVLVVDRPVNEAEEARIAKQQMACLRRCMSTPRSLWRVGTLLLPFWMARERDAGRRGRTQLLIRTVSMKDSCNCKTL